MTENDLIRTIRECYISNVAKNLVIKFSNNRFIKFNNDMVEFHHYDNFIDSCDINDMKTLYILINNFYAI